MSSSVNYIRWIGAFRKSREYNLQKALDFELISKSEKACEKVFDLTPQVRSKIGLLVDRCAIIATFKGDVWSVNTTDGRLERTRKPAKSAHTEAFCRPIYRGVVIHYTLNRTAKRRVWYWCQKNQMTLYLITSKKQLVKVVERKRIL